MFREFTNEDMNWIKRMLEQINQSARDIFEDAVVNGHLLHAYMIELPQNRGVFTVIQGDDYYSIQVSFERDCDDYQAIEFMKAEINRVIKEKGDNDVYLNMNGYNSILTHILADSQFVRDSLGFEFVIQKNECMLGFNDSMLGDLEVKRYNPQCAIQYLKLLDDAFRLQNMECGEQQDTYVQNKNGNTAMLKNTDDNHCFYSFWIQDQLVGLCYFDENYLDTLAIHPKFQNSGFGSRILKYCVARQMKEKQFDELYLHTYYENHAAQRLYIKNGFHIRGFYCENTYFESL